MGTPAFPMAAKTEMKSQTIMVPKDSSIAAFCMRKMDVTRIKAAQPFMLMVVQMGRTKRLMEGLMRMFSSAEAMVTGALQRNSL